jgi:hypothetical protein
VGDLPTTGNLPGDAHLVTATGDLYIWGTDNTWHATGHVQGPPGPAGPLDILTDVVAPVDTPAGKVLGTTATGQWGPVDPPSGGGDPRAAEVVAATYGAATLPPAWVAQAYPAGATVTHGDAVWVAAVGGAGAGEVPGTSHFAWSRTDAAHLRELLEAAVGQPEGVYEWVPTEMYRDGSLVTHNGRLWRGGKIVIAGKEPGVAPEWEPFDLSALVDPTGLSQVAAAAGTTKPAGFLAHQAVQSYTTTLGTVWIARHDTTTIPPAGLTSTADWRRVTPAENAKAIHELSTRIPDPTGVPVGHVLKITATGPQWAAP